MGCVLNGLVFTGAGSSFGQLSNVLFRHEKPSEIFVYQLFTQNYAVLLYNMCLFNSLVEVTDCGSPYSVRDSTYSYSGTEYGHNATYRCDTGFVFSNGSDVLLSACEAYGNWTALEETCVGKCPLFSFVNFITDSVSSAKNLLIVVS